MADFPDPQFDEKGFEFDGSQDDNVNGPLGEREGEGESSENNASEGILAAMADIGDIGEEAGVQEHKVHDQEDDLWGKMQTEEKRRSTPRDS